MSKTDVILLSKTHKQKFRKFFDTRLKVGRETLYSKKK